MYHTGVMKLADFGLSKSLPMNKHAGFDLVRRIAFSFSSFGFFSK